MKRGQRLHGFTVVELIIVVAVIAILVAVTLVAYGTWQQRIADTAVKADLKQAASLLASVHNFKNTYPTSLYSDELSSDNQPSFKPSDNSTVILKTNATTLPQYTGLTNAQNTQLFLDACNSAMPVVGSSGTTYYTSCYAFITGLLQFRLASANRTAYIANPVQSDFTIACTKFLGSCNEPDYDAAAASAITKIKERFSNQQGTYPVNMPLLFFGAVLPEPSSFYSYDDATKFCLEGVPKKFPDRVFHLKGSAEKAIESGPCPTDPNDF